ncbi:GlxA family transcriptional regulator [Hyphomonas sp.]|uniref:GlxA family transcriptional regulator n=1 Tax=Hyphomonas sp. TaxID=87 RepID=UPI00391C26D0
MISAKSPLREIAILLFEDFQLLDASGPVAAFEMPMRGMEPPPYRLALYSLDGGAVRSSSGAAMLTEALPNSLAPDTLIVSGGEGTHAAIADARLIDAIRRISARARRTASVCSGAFLLAEAGLLDGRRATTHWRRAEALAGRYPEVQVEADRIYVRDGKFWTSAGISAGIDLALALIEDDLGPETARRAARELVLYHRRQGGQSQFSVMQDIGRAAGRFDALIGWVQANLAADLGVERLAAEAAMSPRNFARLFRAETGTTPARFIEKLRLEAARARIEGSRQSLQDIAAATGFGEAERMRTAFLRAYGQPPMVLRRQAQGVRS